MNEQFFSKHYIEIDSSGNIIKGFSDAFQESADHSIPINGKGGYQFRLFPGGEENPTLFDGWRVPLYKWDGTRVIERNQEELATDRPEPVPPTPTQVERIEVLEAAVLEMAIETFMKEA